MAKISDKAQGEAKPRKLTVKQEAFAQAYVETSNASEAYRKCYDCENSSERVVWTNACKVLKNNKVAIRVAQIQAQHAERNAVDVDYLTAEYRDVLFKSKESGQFGPAVSAITAIGKLHGLITDKVDHNVKHSLGEEFENFIRQLNGDDYAPKRLEAETIDAEFTE